MRLNPQQAPLYGECVLTVQLDHEDVNNATEEEEVEFYLIFSGSTQRHVSSTLHINHFTLQAVCPAHNMCEQVLVTLCLARPDGPMDTQSQETFYFVQDLALDMAQFLLDSTAPQEASLLDDEQIPLKECERLDASLALALKHLSLPHHQSAPRAPSHTPTDMDGQMDNQKQTVTVTDSCTQHDTEMHQETWMDISSLQDSCPVVSQCQRLSSLMHLAASHGLKTVALFLLQQPGGKEALKRTNTQGQTPACLAKTRGHHLLVELFTQYETFSDVQVEAEEKLLFYPGGRVFQHHENLGTYTLTFSDLPQREGESDEDSSGGCSLQEKVQELRRLIQLHRVSKDKSDFAPTHVSIDEERVRHTCGLQSCCNGQQESRQDEGLAVISIDNCSTKTEEAGSPRSLGARTQGEDSAVVTHTSGRLCHSQEAGREQKGTPAANCPAGQKKKNKKRTNKTTRRAAEAQENNTSTPKASRRTAQKSTKTNGSGSVSPREQAVTPLIGDSGKNQCSPGTQETLLAIKPVLVPSGDEKCAGRKAVALPTTTIVEKQEVEKWEVELLMCERVVETETEIQTEQEDTQSLPTEEALESAAERTGTLYVTMGQEQSQDPQQNQSDTEEPSQPHFINKSPQHGTRTSPRSPDVEGTRRRVLWRDGGWIGSLPEPKGKTVWYQGENVDQCADEDFNRKEVNSLSIWYDTDTVDERKDGQLEKGMREEGECDLSSPQASGLSSSQLEQGLNFHQLSAALCQPHAAGIQPALSHGLHAQRQEANGSQREEEVRSDWKEERVVGCREDFQNRETTDGRKSSETADITEGGDEKAESEERGAKGKKKRRKKRGKKGGAEVKLSSSSSVESQSQIETQREQGTNISAQFETDSVFKADFQPATASEATQGEEADEDAMHLPRRTEVLTRDAHGPDSDVTDTVCSFTSKLLSHTDDMKINWTETPASQTVETKELSTDKNMNFHGPDCSEPDSAIVVSELTETDISKVDTEKMATVQPVAMELLDPTELESKGHNVESATLSENKDLAVATKSTASENQRGLVESYCPKEQAVTDSDPTELTVDSCLLETLHSVDTMELPVGFLESVHPTECAGLPFEDRADASPLQIQEGNTDTTAREYLEHCLASEMLRDQQHNEEKRNELWVGEEEVGKARSGERKSKENDSRMVHGKKSCLKERRKQAEDEGFSSLDREKELKCDEELVAAAVAVVTVAIASAVAKIELSQHLVDSQSESQEAASSSPLKQDSNIASVAVKQLADDFVNTVQSTQMSAKLIDGDNCPLPAVTPAETENQPVLHLHRELCHQSSSKEQADVQISEKSDFVELLCTTKAEKLPTALLNSKDHPQHDLLALGDARSLPQCDEEKIQTEAIQNKPFACSLLKEGSPLHAHTEPSAEETEMIEVESHAHIQTDILLHKESQPLCPVIDTGQDPVDAVSEESLILTVYPKDQTICPKEGAGQQLDVHDMYDGCFVQQYETEGQTHSACTAEDSNTSDTHCHTKELESRSSTLSVTPGDLTDAVDPGPEEPIPTVNVETGEILSSANTKSVTVTTVELDSVSNHGEDPESVAVDDKDGVLKGLDEDSDMLDTVDGWKERERSRMKREVEPKEEMVTVEDTFQTEAELFPAAEEAERDLESTCTLQIKRENDVLYPVQSSLEHSPVTPCTDIHPDRGECVSVCLLHRDTIVEDSLEVNADLDDRVFKKPKDPLSFVGHMDKQVRVSWPSTDDALMQEAFSPGKGTLSSGTPETAAPQNSRLSWKSETEDRGGGETEGMGNIEENKDQLSGNPASSADLCASVRSLSPFRRHSWEPGKINTATHIDIAQHSSLKSLSEEVKKAKPPLHRRSMSWCPSNLRCPNQEQIDNRSSSLEGLEVGRTAVQTQCPSFSDPEERAAGTSLHFDNQDRGSLVSLTEEEQEGDGSSIDSQTLHQVLSATTSCPAIIHHQTVTKSFSTLTISHRDIDGVSSLSGNSESLGYSISEEPGPLRSDIEERGPKISRTFSYLRSKMSKKGKVRKRVSQTSHCSVRGPPH
ncbi:uncharacterized protein LOC103373583 isoform X1 [Stegastes partitus]|uniref:Uncharacterized protein LOC103373583 isoform X1 n=1 Tax=Stegastes partitus TaxID=144197 RepID=A0A9Y4U287_9TELE|nr:PREDICTED: uncharacterized protein LOC103373583 isoform X1 [Stegastes partitus]